MMAVGQLLVYIPTPLSPFPHDPPLGIEGGCEAIRVTCRQVRQRRDRKDKAYEEG